MPEGGRGSLSRRLATEVLAWYGLVAAFLAYYVLRAGAPIESIAPHLRIVTGVFLAVALARLAWTALAGTTRTAQALGALLFWSVTMALAAFYAVALVGLASWGRVTTWELVASYAPQLPSLMQAIGVPVVAAIAAAAIALVMLLGIAWMHARYSWPALAAARIGRWPLALGSAALLALVIVDLHEYMVVPPVKQQEPVSLSFYPNDAAVPLQSHGMDPAAAARRAAAEEAVRGAYRPAPLERRRNLVVIVVDALRADHMGVYGYARDTTPHLARLQAEGVARRAQPVHAACAESLCGLLSLATSRYVHQFAPRMFSLQEVLSRHGYRVLMILGGDHTNFYGLREQYGRVDLYWDASAAGDGYMNDDSVVVDRVRALPDWDGRPVAIQFHLMSPHVLGRRQERSQAFMPAANYFLTGNRLDAQSGRPAARAINFYDNGVREADAVIHELLTLLERKGYLREAVVAVTADHGEALGEHGFWLHQQGLYREVLEVPLLLLAYGYRPAERIDTHALPSQTDIAPTLLHELGMPAPSSWAGRPLQGATLDDFAFFEQGSLAGLLDRRDPANPWKYWEDLRRTRGFAFQLAQDRAESRNRIGDVPAGLRREWDLRMLPVKAQHVAPHGVKP
jgi:glucan phosphoethanolaminetransferase (alkaline phosphatase superfamily)